MEPPCSADTIAGRMTDQRLAPMAGRLEALPRALGPSASLRAGAPRTLRADSGYFSAANVEACTGAGIEPLIAEPTLGEAEGADSPFIHLRASASLPRRRRRTIPPRSRPWPTAWRCPKAKGSTPCASRRPNRCSASSNPPSASDSCRGAGSTRPAANGASYPGLEHQAHVRPEGRSRTADRSPPGKPGATDTRRRSGQCTQAPNRPKAGFLCPQIAAQPPSPTLARQAAGGFANVTC